MFRYPTGRIIKIEIAKEIYELNLTEARVLRKMVDEQIFFAEHSVHPTLGILRFFQAFFYALQVFNRTAFRRPPQRG